MKILFRHEKPRPIQHELMREIYSAIREGKHVIAHAPTGIGKTDAVLSPAITYALDNGKLVVFLSPKIAQHVMALKVVSGISRKHSINMRAVEFVGKQYMCVHPIARRLKGEEFYELCKRMREKEVCPFYVNFLGDERSSFWPLFGENIVSHEDVLQVAESLQECPYEVSSELIGDADVVIGDYYHLFSPAGKAFRKKILRKLQDVILIIDEAHNLPERIRKVLSVSLSTRTLNSAIKEVNELDPDAADLLRTFLDTVLQNSSSLPPGKEAKIEREDLVEWADFDMESFSERLEDVGKEYLELTGKGKSAALRVARFFSRWNDEGPYLHYVRKWSDGVTVSITKRSLDPAIASEEIFSEVHSAVLVSGTLTPGEMYRDLLGMAKHRTIIREYPSPFPRENRLVLIVPTVTTKFSRRRPSEYERIAREVMRIVNEIPGNTAVFFPSYDVLTSVLPFLDFDFRPVFIQRPDMRPEDVSALLSAFRANRNRNAVLLAVAGGSLAEGVDYPDRDLLAAIVVGIPLAEMNLETKALIEYYEEKFGKGWFYGYIYPAISKALQAAGRVIRSESDRGVLVFLDERYTWKNYWKALPKDLDPIVTEDPLPYIHRFWSHS